MGQLYSPAIEDWRLTEIERRAEARAKDEYCLNCRFALKPGENTIISDQFPEISIGYCPRADAFLAEEDHPAEFDCLEWD